MIVCQRCKHELTRAHECQPRPLEFAGERLNSRGTDQAGPLCVDHFCDACFDVVSRALARAYGEAVAGGRLDIYPDETPKTWATFEAPAFPVLERSPEPCSRRAS